MEIPAVIIAIGILIFLAHFSGWLFSFVRIPDVLILMSIGILLGPLLGIVSPDFMGEAGNVLITISLIIILFEGALRLRFDSLKKAMFGTVFLALSSFFLTMAGVGILLYQFADFPFLLAFLIGAIVGSNSTALVIPLVERLKIKEESRTTLFLESGLSDVFSIVFTLALIASLEIGVFNIATVTGDIFSNLLMATIMGGVFAFFWSLFLNKVHNMQNSVFATPAFVFIVFGLTELLGYSGLISIISFGIVLGNTPLLISSWREKNNILYNAFHPKPLSSREHTFFSEMVFVIKIFFFTFIGISLNFENLSIMLLGVLVAIFIFAIRLFSVIISIPKSTPRFDASIMAVTVPRGLAPAVLALIPIQKGLEGGVIVQETTYSIIFFSIFFTSVLIFLLHNSALRKIYTGLLSPFSNEKES